MPAFLYAGFLLIFLYTSLFFPVVFVYSSFPVTLTLERAFPANHKVQFEQLKVRDKVRRGRFLQSSGGGIVNFPVDGSPDPFTVGLYFTRVKLGSPPKEFYVQIDTGSDILWVACESCQGCPKSSGLGIQLELYGPRSSSSASLISCSNEICSLAVQTAEAGCSSQNNQCKYTFQYGDGSGTSGFFVSDELYFDAIVGDSSTVNSSAPVVFGCSDYQSGDLTKPDRAVDGIFGFGQHELSVISQLSSRGITPKVFSHCLKGKDNGGGILVLGEIVEPGIVYSPLVPSQPHYNLNLQSISVNGQIVPIDPAVFETSRNRGTIVDSGTTLAYLPEEAYNPFFTVLTAAVSQSVRSFILKGNECFLVTGSVNELFPSVAFNFAGGASIGLKPGDYLISQGYLDGAALWCLGFQKDSGQGITILGDLVLKDKIFVYDLGRQRIGWADYDCSQSVNVSLATGKDEFINAAQISVSSSTQAGLYKLVQIITGSFLVHIFIFSRLTSL
ncbi:Aspartyl protease apcb1 [Thalictrum thalictroides]|uniref:Aspartyl protease apcb1 n=1 Tax=Thalictrum thalictroides TaxID=46969 RepID=A0A7J6VKH6_THATH|nr:Aspartyl protease apcb1 [Thalictrum thalictroides]